ncbi:MAG: hypothetical protein A2Y07_04630 [Planctomycetes bacterium GWF2_50_10]|nr:MAG: hypothetical protein A2Y07_04630 [Planctomycetes bacterium GWF2_50_10]
MEVVRKLSKKIINGGCDGEDVIELFIEYGSLETGLCDHFCQRRDIENEVMTIAREAAMETGLCVYYSWLGDLAKACEAAKRFLILLDMIERSGLPEVLVETVGEGYCYYCLYPQMYMAAAAEFIKRERPRSAVCIGLRSIGTSLSAAVGAVLGANGCEVELVTLRPRGKPFSRRPVLEEQFRNGLLARIARCDHVLIVDEGPGLSGSSICGAAEYLADCGVDERKMAVFCSWEADGDAFKNNRARNRWARLKKYFKSFDEVMLGAGKIIESGADDVIDISGGKWRGLMYSNEEQYPAVNAHLERRKFVARYGKRRYLYKFAGLGKWGRAIFARANVLADAGFSPISAGLANGFIVCEFEDGRPMARDVIGNVLLTRAAEYIAFTRKHFEIAGENDTEYLGHIIENNVRIGLGIDVDVSAMAREVNGFAGSCRVGVDGRMMSFEWIQTARGLIKVDSAFHFDDHFWPGPTDIAWDIAGTIVECDLDEGSQNFFVNEYTRLSGDLHVRSRLGFYLCVYLAVRMGHASFAINQSISLDDAGRFRFLLDYYAKLLKMELESVNGAVKACGGRER